MTLYRGDTKIESLYHGSDEVERLYRGDTLVFNSIVAAVPGQKLDPPVEMINAGDSSRASHSTFQGRPLMYWNAAIPGRTEFEKIRAGDLVELDENGVKTLIRATSTFDPGFQGYIYFDANWESPTDTRTTLEPRTYTLTRIWAGATAQDAVDQAILGENPVHYWKLDYEPPFEDLGSIPEPLVVSVDNGLLTQQAVAGKFIGITLPTNTLLTGVGCIPDNTIGETYMFFTDVNDTTAIEVAGVSVGNNNLRLRSQYSIGVGSYPNWRITGTNRNPSELATTGVPAMYSGGNSGTGTGLVFSEVEWPTGGGASGSQGGQHTYAGRDLKISSLGAGGSANLARLAVFDSRLASATLQSIFDAYVNL